MAARRWSCRTVRIATGTVLAVLVVLATAGVPGPPQRARAAVSGLGAGIFSVDGAFAENLTLPLGGTYYLTVATDSASTRVNASLAYNGTLLAQENASLSGTTFASLPAGNYSLVLTGRGRAALGWDFTNGAVQDFPDNATLVAFLAPQGPKVQVYVSRGNAQTIQLSLYDDALLPAGNATVSSDGPVTFVLPASAASVSYLLARVTEGAPDGIYGLSWSAGPISPPLDFTAWPLFLLWILVPVAAALVAFVLLHRRGRL